MKTLDEVIKELQYWDTCNEYPECFYDDEVNRDALHYLKEYRETKKHLACLDNAEIRGDNTQVVNNSPLTWDELKTMEGKPIWVEYEGYAPDWEVIEYIGNTKWKWGEVIETHLSILHKENQGKEWQAYRKERK